MNVDDVIAEFRSQVDDEAPPYLWSDPSAMLYLADAQDRLVKACGGITDLTAVATDAGVIANPPTKFADLVVAQNAVSTAHSQFWLRIRSIRLVTAKVDLTIINESDMRVIPVRDYGWTRGLNLDDTDVGDVRFAVLGILENQIRWLRVPNVADTARVHFYRLPYPRLTDVNGPPLEVTSDHHLHLVKWMKYLAYSKEDAETYDKKLSEINKAAFEEYCEQARKEIERRRYKPRVVQFSCPGY